MNAPFCYELPAERIAQRPVEPYDQAKMLVVQRSHARLEESRFGSIASYLKPADVLVFNNTKVLPARLFGCFAEGGGEVEILLLECRSESAWVCLGRPLKRFKEGRILEFANGLRAQVSERISSHHVLLDFSAPRGRSLKEEMRKAGVMPIPPYIRRGLGDAKDLHDYQTFFAQHEGSVAAPTASLHFTPELVDKIRALGCAIEFVTLHLGTASFLPLWNEGEESEKAPAHPAEERGFFDADLIGRLQAARARGGRVVAVGTSVVRILETIARSDCSAPGVRDLKCDLFIEPGFEFRLVDCLVTNFHQPRTTHLLLVQAFMGKNLLDASYAYALQHDFRFLSYGDGMLVS